MKKLRLIPLIITSLVGLPLSGFAQAGKYTELYENLPVKLAEVQAVVFPDKTVSIADFGCVGDAVTLNTEGIQRAIDETAAKGGGRVVVPAGVWLIGPIELKDNIDLHLERNAVLFLSPDKSLYADKTPGAKRARPCISADKRKNVGITGDGIIDGNGVQWRYVKRMKVSDVEWRRFQEMGGVLRQNDSQWFPWDLKNGSPNFGATPEKQESLRNDLVRIADCENVLLEGVTFQNSPRFHVHPFNCRNVIIDGIAVRCPWNAQNGDGIDISDCHRVLIQNCTVDTGDDGICMKSSEAKPGSTINGCEDILIRRNTVYHAHGGFVLGSNTVYGMRRIVVEDCTFSGTDTGLRFKSAPGRGGKTEDIYIRNVMMTDIVNEAIIFHCDYANVQAKGKEAALQAQAKEAEKGHLPEFADIHIFDITCLGAAVGISAAGIEGLNCVHDIDISRSTIVYSREAKKIDEATAKVKLSDVKLYEYK